MSLFYMKDHTSCDHYVGDVNSNLRLMHGKKSELLYDGEFSSNLLLFVLKGSISIEYECVKTTIISSGQFCFHAKGTYRKEIALTDYEIIIVSFDHILNLCDRLSMNSLDKEKGNMLYNFQSLPCNEVMMLYLNLLKIYLEDGAKCASLLDIKLKELFWLLRAYYTKKELANLFYQIVGKSLDFRSNVLSNYKSAGSAIELARKCGYNNTTFKKLFYKEFGETPYAWMQKHILELIRIRLANPDMLLKDIVDEFSLSSINHLSRLCKTYLGKSPTKIRQEILEIRNQSND